MPLPKTSKSKALKRFNALEDGEVYIDPARRVDAYSLPKQDSGSSAYQKALINDIAHGTFGCQEMDDKKQGLIVRVKRKEDASIKYEVIMNKKIGKGAHGEVRIGMNTEDGQMMAVKMMRISSFEQKVGLRAYRNEAAILSFLHHPNIVHYYDFFMGPMGRTVMLFMEYENTDTLEATLHQYYFSLPERLVRHFSFELLSALYYCHANNIMHRDIKVQNVLLKTTGELQLADFGSAICDAKPFSLTHNKFGCTPLYKAPELALLSFQHGTYTDKIDVWSMGFVLYAMVSSQHDPWPASSQTGGAAAFERFLVRNDATPTVANTADISPQLRDLLECMFIRHPGLRPSAEQLLHHPFFHPYYPSDKLLRASGLSASAHEFSRRGGGARGGDGRGRGDGGSGDEAGSVSGGSEHAMSPAYRYKDCATFRNALLENFRTSLHTQAQEQAQTQTQVQVNAQAQVHAHAHALNRHGHRHRHTHTHTYMHTCIQAQAQAQAHTSMSADAEQWQRIKTVAECLYPVNNLDTTKTRQYAQERALPSAIAAIPHNTYNSEPSGGDGGDGGDDGDSGCRRAEVKEKRCSRQDQLLANGSGGDYDSKTSVRGADRSGNDDDHTSSACTRTHAYASSRTEEREHERELEARLERELLQDNTSLMHTEKVTREEKGDFIDYMCASLSQAEVSAENIDHYSLVQPAQLQDYWERAVAGAGADILTASCERGRNSINDQHAQQANDGDGSADIDGVRNCAVDSGNDSGSSTHACSTDEKSNKKENKNRQRRPRQQRPESMCEETFRDCGGSSAIFG